MWIAYRLARSLQAWRGRICADEKIVKAGALGKRPDPLRYQDSMKTNRRGWNGVFPALTRSLAVLRLNSSHGKDSSMLVLTRQKGQKIHVEIGGERWY